MGGYPSNKNLALHPGQVNGFLRWKVCARKRKQQVVLHYASGFPVDRLLLCIRARLQSCHQWLKMVGALAPGKPQGLKPNFGSHLFGTTQVVP
jgi:hypothetical protein